MKILCVDDNDIHRYSICRLMEHAGYNVVSAASGSEAIAKATDECPDVVLLDINIPDVNGYEVCARIRADSRTASIPVIFYTGQVSGIAKAHSELVGGDAFFTYPVSLDQVKTTIQGVVSKAQNARSKQA